MVETVIEKLLRRRPGLFDGAIGTELMRRGLPQGHPPELWNAERPEILRDIHAAYFAAGADVVTTNTFGANPLKLASVGLGDRVRELNRSAVERVLEVRPAGRLAAGSLGPTGKFLKPQGEASEADFEAAFAAQAGELAAAGADLLIIETMFDLREAACALRAARASSSLPVFVTMTFNKTPRGFFTLMGQSVGRCCVELEGLGAAALGANCTLTSREMVELARDLRGQTALPLLIQPNAGQPQMTPEGSFSYRQTPEAFVADAVCIVGQGVEVVGGCCGTTPEHIKRLASLLRPA